MQKTLVTIFVTVYNIEKYLKRFFDCLDKQTFKNYKVLMIDDGSTDNSLSICRAYAEKDSRIKVVENEHIGISATRNILLRLLDTEFATSLDGDDYFGPEYLKHLMDAQKKYDADYVISNVITVEHDGYEVSRFKPRKEAFFTKEQLLDILPDLLVEKRLNYLYTKLFRTKYLKDIRVEPDVKQGSDTMINMQYALGINNLAVIEDYDYYYVQYHNHSVTSYSGTDFFWRLYRINKYLYDLTEQKGFLNDKMLCAIDVRIIISERVAFNRLESIDTTMETKLAAAHKIMYCDEYLQSYNRLKEKGQLETLNYNVIHPVEKGSFSQYVYKEFKEIKKRRTKRKILRYMPTPIFNAFHSLKKRLGLIP